MHVGMIIDSLIPNGAQKVVQELAEGLVKRDKQITVFFYHNFGNKQLSIEERLKSSGCKVVWVRGPRIDHRRYVAKVDAVRTTRFVKKLGINLVNLHTWERAYSLRVARRLPVKLPVVVTHHGTRICNRGIPLASRMHLGVNSRYRYEYEDRDNNSNCSAIDIGINKEALDEAKLPKNKARKYLRLSPHKPVLLTIGRCNRHKGCDIWIEVVKRMQARHAESFIFAFIGAFAGGGYNPNYYSALLALREQHHNVVMLPILPHEEVIRWLCAADLLLVTSRTESFGLKAVEGLYCGCPVVTHYLGVLVDVIQSGNNGAIVDYMDVDALIDASIAWLTHPKTVTAKIPQRYFADTMVERYEQCFQRMLNGGSDQ